MSAPPPAAPLDVVTLAIALITALLGPGSAAIVGPYVVILLGAVMGSAWSASRRETETRLATARHMFLHVSLALLATVPIALMLGRWLEFDDRWLLGPVAAVIGGIGHDWPAVFRWALDLGKRTVESIAQRKAGGQQ